MTRLLRGFGCMWFGQLVSVIGSGLTRFALGVWVFRRTGSVTQFSIISLFATIPALLVSPLAGVMVDRWDRRRVLIWSNLVAGFGVPLAIGVLLQVATLELWQIYVMEALVSVVGAFQWPAYVATTSAIVAKRHLARASGMVQLAAAAAEVVAPVLASLLIVAVGLFGIVVIDFATFLFAAGTLLLVRIPGGGTAAAAGRRPGDVPRRPLLHDAAAGWTFVRERPGLLGLLACFAMINLVFAAASVLITPMVLSFTNPSGLALVLSVGSAGLLAGGVVMSISGGPPRRIHGVFGCGLLFSAAMAVGGLRPNVHLIAGALFVFMFGLPLINGSSQAIWQVKVPLALQGRVFAVRRIISLCTAPIGFFAAGPLADRVFEPLLAPGGGLASSVGRVIGVGKGRGMALMFIAMSLVPFLASLWGYAQPRIRRVEDELPDALPPVQLAAATAKTLTART